MTDDLLAAGITVADHDLEDPAVRAAARAVIDDLTAIAPSLTPSRRHARRAVAVAAACLVAAGAAAAYTVASGTGTPGPDPGAVTGSTEPVPEDLGDIDALCDELRSWLAPETVTDVEAARRLHRIDQYLALYEYNAELVDEPREAARVKLLEAAMAVGDRGVIEEFVAQKCPA